MRRIRPDLKGAISGLDPVTDAPPRDKVDRKARVERSDRGGVVEHSSHSGRRHRPSYPRRDSRRAKRQSENAIGRDRRAEPQL